MLRMILLMTAATSLYVAITALLWRFWHKRAPQKLGLKLVIGLIYGLCSIASNHLAIEYNFMLLNVRDIGPLAAGLFFSPLSGILSGLIGGVERFIIGEYFGIGTFTRVACSLSTALAGLLAAALHKWIYNGTMPRASHAFFLGAMMEAFHMYVVLITHRNEMTIANFVVHTSSVPMITFTSIGLALCSIVIALQSDKFQRINLFSPIERTPISLRFQRWLLLVMLVLFSFSSYASYRFQTKTSSENASVNLMLIAAQYQARYEEENSIEPLVRSVEDQPMTADIIYEIIDMETRTVLANSINTTLVGTYITPKDAALILNYAEGDYFTAPISSFYGAECLGVSLKLDDRYYLLIASPTASIYSNRDSDIYESLFSDIIMFTILYILIAKVADLLVVRNLKRVNRSLDRITDGDLEVQVSVHDSSEFSALSEDINKTVTALRGYIDAAEKRMEEDLKLAAAIQEAALPKNFQFPRNDFEIYALMDPAKEVGGDFYDFFFIDNNTLVLVIADVSGKSIPGAMFMMRSKTAIKNFARHGNSPAELLTNVNNVLCEGNDAEMFVTVWIGILDLATGNLRCANAGHEFPVMMRVGGAYELLRDKHGLVLAAMENVPVREYALKLNPGDRLFLYTDGVPEAINEKTEAYGTERLVNRLNQLRTLPEQQVLEGVIADLRAFVGNAEQFDDITMMGFTYNGKSDGTHAPSSPEEKTSVPS